MLLIQTFHLIILQLFIFHEILMSVVQNEIFFAFFSLSLYLSLSSSPSLFLIFILEIYGQYTFWSVFSSELYAVNELISEWPFTSDLFFYKRLTLILAKLRICCTCLVQNYLYKQSNFEAFASNSVIYGVWQDMGKNKGWPFHTKSKNVCIRQSREEEKTQASVKYFAWICDHDYKNVPT